MNKGRNDLMAMQEFQESNEQPGGQPFNAVPSASC